MLAAISPRVKQMELWLIVWAGVLAIVFLAAMGLRTLRRKADEAAPAPAAVQPPSPPITPAPPELNALTLARRLEPLYEACAHPSDLLGRPEFEQGVSALSEAAVPLE